MRTILFIILLIPSLCFGQFNLPEIGEHLEIIQILDSTSVVFLSPKSDTLFTNYTLNIIDENIDSIGAKLLVTTTKKDSLLVLASGTKIRDSVRVDSIKVFVQPVGENWTIVHEKSLILNDTYHLVKLKRKDKKKVHWLEICKGNKCQLSGLPLTENYSCTDFKVLFSETLNKLNAGVDQARIAASNQDETNDKVNDFCEDLKNEARVAKVNQSLIEERDSALAAMEELKHEDAGIMEMIKEMDVEYHQCEEKICKKKWYQWHKKKRKKDDTCKLKFSKCNDAYELPSKENRIVFKPHSAWFRANYYRISDVCITGYLVKGIDSVEISVDNPSYGFSLNGLTGIHNHTFSINKKVRLGEEDYWVKFYYGDILNYKPSKNTFSKFIVNTEHTLTRKSNEVVLKKRNINNFVSATVFTDFLGFIDETPNSLLQTEVSAEIPFNSKNKKTTNFLPSIKGTLNFSSISGLGENSHYVQPEYTDAAKLLDTIYNLDTTILRVDTALIFPDSGYINAIDMLRYSDVDFSFKGRIWAFECKNLNSFFNVDVGYRLFRSKVDLSSNPAISNIRSRYIHSPELDFSFSLRPDWIVGADISLGALYFTTFQHGSPLLPGLELNDEEGNKPANRFVLRNEFNAYTYLTKNSKSGLFVRYRGYHSFKKIGQYKKRQYFPMILVGYSTNLSTLIKGKFDD